LPLEVGAINGGILLRNTEVQAPVFAINVSSIDEKVLKIMEAGGSVVKPKMEMMGMGFYAYVKDTEGNVIGLWEDAKK
jgi:predicted enzyme related to lactoylglutathione lyase